MSRTRDSNLKAQEALATIFFLSPADTVGTTLVITTN
jgi:hypothetical protein